LPISSIFLTHQARLLAQGCALWRLFYSIPIAITLRGRQTSFFDFQLHFCLWAAKLQARECGGGLISSNYGIMDRHSTCSAPNSLSTDRESNSLPD
jgi:hypothetical protein